MRFRRLLRVLFILYCVEAGTLYLMLPWSGVWDRMILQLPAVRLHLIALDPLVRSFVSGFGLVHILWALHDLDLWLISGRSKSASGP